MKIPDEPRLGCVDRCRCARRSFRLTESSADRPWKLAEASRESSDPKLAERSRNREFLFLPTSASALGRERGNGKLCIRTKFRVNYGPLLFRSAVLCRPRARGSASVVRHAEYKSFPRSLWEHRYIFRIRVPGESPSSAVSTGKVTRKLFNRNGLESRRGNLNTGY